MPWVKSDQLQLNAAVRILAKRDQKLRGAVRKFGYPTSRRSPAGFATLARIIVDQQISTAAAASIWKKLNATIGRVSAKAVSIARTEQLRAAGLSASKIKTLRTLASAIEERAFTLQGLSRRSDEQVRSQLTRIWGIGDWTVDIYLMFGLDRPDVWPTGDLALRTGWQYITGNRKRIDAIKLEKLAETWRPYRSAAAILIWHALSTSR